MALWYSIRSCVFLPSMIWEVSTITTQFLFHLSGSFSFFVCEIEINKPLSLVAAPLEGVALIQFYREYMQLWGPIWSTYPVGGPPLELWLWEPNQGRRVRVHIVRRSSVMRNKAAKLDLKIRHLDPKLHTVTAPEGFLQLWSAESISDIWMGLSVSISHKHSGAARASLGHFDQIL